MLKSKRYMLFVLALAIGSVGFTAPISAASKPVTTMSAYAKVLSISRTAAKPNTLLVKAETFVAKGYSVTFDLQAEISSDPLANPFWVFGMVAKPGPSGLFVFTVRVNPHPGIHEKSLVLPKSHFKVTWYASFEGSDRLGKNVLTLNSV